VEQNLVSALADQRKTHERAEDRKRQRAALVELCARKGLTFTMQETHSRYDAKLYKNKKLVALAEVKHRNHAFGTYKDYTVDEDKLAAMRKIAHSLGISAVLVVSWQGDVRHAVINQQFKQSIQKRRDRDELADAVAHVPLHLFVVPPTAEQDDDESEVETKESTARYRCRSRDGDYFAGWLGTNWETVKRVATWTLDQSKATALTLRQWNASGHIELVCGFAGCVLEAE
jgi:hypothetical protein